MNDEKLEIIPLDKKIKVNKKIKKLNKLLPIPPFRWSFVGASKSGKTTLICNLFRKGFYRNFWDRNHIFVFSPTSNLDDKLKECIPSNHFYERFEPDIIKEIYDEQLAIKRMYGAGRMDHMLIILDDMLGTDALKSTSIISKYIHKTRHFNVSYIYSVQKYTGLPRVMRLNSDVITIFRCSNFGEIDSITEESSDKDNKSAFKKIIKDIFLEPFAFLLIDYQTHDLSKRYRKGFDIILKNPMLNH
jgi:Poxvirus A32 protein